MFAVMDNRASSFTAPLGSSACPARSPWVRWLCLAGGAGCVLIGGVGIFVPILPTTPFLLLAVACFARSSQRLHCAILQHPWAGPLIRDWELRRSLPRKVKQGAILMMTCSFILSISVLQPMMAKLGLFALWALLLFFIVRIPSYRPENINKHE
jgi:uncharacterized membrane protein YbaN (DUF454 family)